MERHLKKLTLKLGSYLETCRDLMLYLPYEGIELAEFLGSCFHRKFCAVLKERGFCETALFTENRKHGRVFLFLSNRNIDFDISTARALLQARVLSEVDAKAEMDAWSCYSFRTNKLLDCGNFYSPARAGDLLAPVLGSEWLLACLATRDRLYDYHLERFVKTPIHHTCYDYAWCEGLQSVYSTAMPDWRALFPPPWNEVHSELQGFYPYRLRKISVLTLSEGGPETKVGDLRFPLSDSNNADAQLYDNEGGNAKPPSLDGPIASGNGNPQGTPKPEISIGPFRVDSEYLRRYRSPWTIGSYEPDGESNYPYDNTEAFGRIKAFGTGMPSDASHAYMTNASVATTHEKISPLLRGNYHNSPVIGSSSRIIMPDSSRSFGLDLAPGDSSDSDAPARALLDAKETQSKGTDTLRPKDLNEPTLPNAGDQNLSKGSDAWKAKKKAYHRRRRQQKAAIKSSANGGVEADNISSDEKTA